MLENPHGIGRQTQRDDRILHGENDWFLAFHNGQTPVLKEVMGHDQLESFFPVGPALFKFLFNAAQYSRNLIALRQLRRQLLLRDGPQLIKREREIENPNLLVCGYGSPDFVLVIRFPHPFQLCQTSVFVSLLLATEDSLVEVSGYGLLPTGRRRSGPTFDQGKSDNERINFAEPSQDAGGMDSQMKVLSFRQFSKCGQ